MLAIHGIPIQAGVEGEEKEAVGRRPPEGEEAVEVVEDRAGVVARVVPEAAGEVVVLAVREAREVRAGPVVREDPVDPGGVEEAPRGARRVKCSAKTHPDVIKDRCAARQENPVVKMV